MLKKLKRRFIAISMSLVTVVLMMFYLTICAAVVVKFNNDIEQVLRDYANATILDVVPSIGDSDKNNSMIAQYSGNVCVVNVSGISGVIQVMDISRANINADVLEFAVNSVLRSGGTFGHINGLNLFYCKSQSLIGTQIAFADSTQYFSYLESMLVAGGCLCVVAIVILFFISNGLANMCLKPVERTWKQQQDFIADASHELKTPLTVILTNSNILQAHKDDTIENQLKWVDSTNEEATHMKELVDKLLLLAKTDNFRQNNKFSDVDMSELTTRLSLQFEPVAYEKGVALNTEIEQGIHLKGDATALNQIVHILLDNAVKYAGLGGEAFLYLSKRQNYVYLSAKNTGAPIPPEDLPHIFERFYRSDKSRTSGSGYGLGLAICKNLAEQHKADITVTSNEASGTVFTVRFRLSR